MPNLYLIRNVQKLLRCLSWISGFRLIWSLKISLNLISSCKCWSWSSTTWIHIIARPGSTNKNLFFLSFSQQHTHESSFWILVKQLLYQPMRYMKLRNTAECKPHNTYSRFQAEHWEKENLSFIFLHINWSGDALLARSEHLPLI